MSNALLDSETECMRTDDEEAEEKLIERARQSPHALGKLYCMHEPRITAYVVRRIGSVQDAEDIVANVFLAMVRHLPRYRPTPAPFSAWLYRVATNEMNWFLRKQRIRGLLVPIVDVADGCRETTDDAECVRVALLKLPIRNQSVLALHYLEQLSVAEIANVLRIAEGTVKSRLSRGRALLKKALT